MHTREEYKSGRNIVFSCQYHVVRSTGARSSSRHRRLVCHSPLPLYYLGILGSTRRSERHHVGACCISARLPYAAPNGAGDGRFRLHAASMDPGVRADLAWLSSYPLTFDRAEKGSVVWSVVLGARIWSLVGSSSRTTIGSWSQTKTNAVRCGWGSETQRQGGEGR